MKFFKTLGFEFTFLYKYQKKDYPNPIGGIVEAVEEELQINSEHSKKSFHVHQDQGILEINSPPFSNLDDVKIFYQWMMKHVSRYPLVPSLPTQMGGGCHIHFAVDNFKLNQKFLVNLFRDSNNRPYFSWMFNDPYDNESAEPQKWKQNWMKNNVIDCYAGNKGSMLRIDERCPGQKPTTVEFRIFDMPKNLNQLVDFIIFVDVYLRFINKRSKNKHFIESIIQDINDLDVYSRLSKRKHIQDFKRFIEEKLKLPYNKYKKYIHNYLQRRYLYHNLCSQKKLKHINSIISHNYQF
jgi:hypothetical protein